MATAYKKTIKRQLPKFYLGGDATQGASSVSADPYLKATQYGVQGINALFPKDQYRQGLYNSTGQGKVNNATDNFLTVGSQFTPTHGTITSIGKSIGDTIENKMPDRAGSVFGEATKYGAAGAEIGNAIVPGIGAAVGGAAGSLYGGVEGYAQYGQMRAAQQDQVKIKQKATQDQLAANYQSAIGQGFKPKGNQDVSYQKYGGKLKKGMYKAGGEITAEKSKQILRDGTANGYDLTDKQKRFFGAIAGGNKPYQKEDGGSVDKPEYEAEKGELVQGHDTNLEEGTQVASDMHVVDGQRHEDGGTMGKGGDRVFSDRIKISPEFSAQMKSQGMGDGGGKTYADIAIRLGKMKGKYEEMSKSTQPYRYNTSKQMLPRIEALTNALFEFQEKGKQEEQTKLMAMGGTIGGKGPSYTMPNGDLKKGGFPRKKKRHDMGGEISSPDDGHEMNEGFIDKSNKDYFAKRAKDVGLKNASKEFKDFHGDEGGLLDKLFVSHKESPDSTKEDKKYLMEVSDDSGDVLFSDTINDKSMYMKLDTIPLNEWQNLYLNKSEIKKPAIKKKKLFE